MFLTPQHFQTADNRVDETIQFRFSSSLFANWGVTDLRLDEESLVNGLFSVRNCSGVLPDGTLFGIPDPDSAPDGRRIEGHFSPAQESLDVFLALPEHQPGRKNFKQRVDAATTRYTADPQEILDENEYADAKTVQVASRNFRLLFGDENRDGFAVLRIARVMRNEAGVYVPEPAFIAPCLNIASSAYLMNLVRRQIEALISKADSLRQRGEPLSDFNSSAVRAFWLEHTVNSSVPELQHIWSVRRGHPEMVWTALLRLAGALSTFSNDPKARDLPQYDHNDLGPCFTALAEKLRVLLDRGIPLNCVSIPLRLVDKSLWAGAVSNDDYFRATFFLAINARIGADELISKVPDRVKIADPDELQDLRQFALPGLRLRHEQNLPPAITFKMNNQYFTISQSGRLWERIVQSRNIGVFIPPDIAEAQPEILAVMQ
jgi:type VI secretion system protein ImpJ